MVVGFSAAVGGGCGPSKHVRHEGLATVVAGAQRSLTLHLDSCHAVLERHYGLLVRRRAPPTWDDGQPWQVPAQHLHRRPRATLPGEHGGGRPGAAPENHRPQEGEQEKKGRDEMGRCERCRRRVPYAAMPVPEPVPVPAWVRPRRLPAWVRYSSLLQHDLLCR
jgi:hypothetical protein